MSDDKNDQREFCLRVGMPSSGSNQEYGHRDSATSWVDSKWFCTNLSDREC